jgi:hypothetical protein
MTEGRSVLGSKLSLALSTMTLSIPVLYLIGYGYYQGYLGAFGVSTDFFPQSVQDYLVSAFFAFSHAIIKTLNIATEKYWIFAIVAALMVGLGILMVWIAGDERKLAIQRKKTKLESHPLYLYFLIPLGLGAFSLVMPYVIIAMLSVVVVVPFAAYWVGNDEGKVAIEAFQECLLDQVPKRHNCVYVYQDDEIQAKGLLIARSNDRIAIYEDGRAIILPSGNSRVVVIARDTAKVNNTIQPTPQSGAADG